MKNVFLTLTISALVLSLGTADAVWGNGSNRTIQTSDGYYTTTPNNYYDQSPTVVNTPYYSTPATTNGQSTPILNSQALEPQRAKHQVQNAYYVQQNGGTISTDSSAAPSATSGQVSNTATSRFSNIPTSRIAGNPALLIQTARLATIERDMYGNTDGFVLTLKGVEPNLAFFNNNGQRTIGKVGISDFVNSLKTTNGASAALVTTSTTPDNAPDLQESVIILSNPVYDARQQTLKFNIDNFNGTNLRAGSHQNAVLLIDSTFMNQ